MRQEGCKGFESLKQPRVVNLDFFGCNEKIKKLKNYLGIRE
jgi:hypothetical protein